MKIQVYDTLSRDLKTFDSERTRHRPLTLYVCGPTVYNLIHVGNARAFTLFDVFVRFLRRVGFRVRYVRNITDVDDKIIQAANSEHISPADLANKYTQAFHEDVDRLMLIRPDQTPRVTSHMPDIISAVDQLIRKKAAYALPDGIYFDVKTFPAYGALSRKKQDELIQGVRVDLTDKKRNPGDFALWKLSKPGEPVWEAPFGAGRPGWHIECSVMSMKYAPEGLDIHGGGIDLIHPHHENEIAQSESLYPGQPFAHAWMHSGFLNIGKEKMSKSLGNFILLRQLLTYFHPEVLRLFLLSGHYRGPLEFSLAKLIEFHHTVWRFYTQKRQLETVLRHISLSGEALRNPIFQVLIQDFNTPKAIGLLFELFRNSVKAFQEKSLTPQHHQDLCHVFQAAEVMGVFESSPDAFFERVEKLILGHVSLSKEQIEDKIQQRKLARAQKNYKTADKIRDELSAHQVSIQDLEDGNASWCFTPSLD